MTETIVETKSCKHCGTTFTITDKDIEFYDKVSPVFAGEKYSIPTPSICPTCRTQRRLAWRNDRSLYKSTCAMTGKSIISMYDPENNYTVYEQQLWRSDAWDPLTYGKTFNADRSFFEQYSELMKIVPRFNLFNMDTENCEFVNYGPHCKNCYLLFGSWFSENCYYGQTMSECKNCVDNTFVDKSEFCYENIDCNSNYESFFCQNCVHAVNSFFCYDCENISNCIGCYNLINKEYHINNKSVSKEEFEQEKAKLSSYKEIEDMKKKYREQWIHKTIHKAYRGGNNENISGDFVFECKNVKNCFSVYRSENLAYCARMFEGKDSYDFDGGGKSELVYENMSNDFSFFSMGCTTCEHLKYAHYCDLCFNCSDCFGCVGLRNKQYCIFNVQYTKEEYENLVQNIIKKMIQDKERGEFPFGQYSPFGYNETMAYEYFPLTKDEALHRQYKRREEKEKDYIQQTYTIPDNIRDVDENILNQIFQCEISKKNFRITPQELAFYKKMNLPLPHKHPDQRHIERMQLRNPRKLFERKCDKCGINIQTTYSPERPEIVYCEECYNKEIYG